MTEPGPNDPIEPADPAVAAALDELAAWHTRDLAGPPPVLPLAAGGAASSGPARAAWWVPAVAAAVVVLVLLVAGRPMAVPVEPAAPAPPAAGPVEGPGAGFGARVALLAVALVPPVLVVATMFALVRRSRSARRRTGALLAGAALLVLVVLTWWTAVPGNPSRFFLGGPGLGYTFIGPAVAVALSLAVVVGGALAGRTFGKGVALAALGLAMAGVIVGAGHDVVLRARFAVDEPALGATARAELAATAGGAVPSGCRPPAVPAVPAVLGRVDEVCVFSATEVAFLRDVHVPTLPGARVRAGIVRSAYGAAAPSGVCVRPIADGWAEQSSLLGADCPDGFTFTGAG